MFRHFNIQRYCIVTNEQTIQALTDKNTRHTPGKVYQGGNETVDSEANSKSKQILDFSCRILRLNSQSDPIFDGFACRSSY